MRTRLLFSLACLGLLGCNTVRLADTVDLVFDFSPGPAPDQLHSPYVAGADLTLLTINVDEEDEARLSIVSDDPSILQVSNTEPGEASASAVGTGTVDLIVENEEGDELHRTAVEVIQPDEARILAHGPMIVGRPELEPTDTDRLRVLVGGSGTFLLRWFANGERLFGNGALSTEHGPGVRAASRRSYLFEDREWVTFTALEPGEHEVQLMANGQVTRTVTVIGVTEEDIATVRLHGMDESQAEEDAILTVYAQAYDADETPIYGVEYEWDLNGASQDGLGDLFRYYYESDVTGDLCARHGSLEAVAQISGREGFVDSTNRIGCSIGASGPGWLGGPLVTGLVALLWVRRRRPSA